ncbi:hypothetical protein KQ921_29895, partial [Klebsiella pneumoniae]|nr:hypothetical protein [Klebsiella pneumoniae]
SSESRFARQNSASAAPTCPAPARSLPCRPRLLGAGYAFYAPLLAQLSYSSPGAAGVSAALPVGNGDTPGCNDYRAVPPYPSINSLICET